MARWQYEYMLVPLVKLTEYLGQIPETLSIDDYDRFSWWDGMPEPNVVEIEKLLPPAEKWSDAVKEWGSDNGNRFSLYYGRDENDKVVGLSTVVVRIDLRREFAEVREFVESIIAMAKENAWGFRAENSAVLE